jgi:hypothetical protein
LIVQLDSLGIIIDNDNRLIPTEKTLGNVFKGVSYDSVAQRDLDIIEALSGSRKKDDKKSLNTKFEFKNVFGF